MNDGDIERWVRANPGEAKALGALVALVLAGLWVQAHRALLLARGLFLWHRFWPLVLLAAVLLAGALAGSLVWRLRPRARGAAAVVRRWPEITKSPPLASVLGGSVARVLTHDPVSWTLMVRLPEGHTPEEVMRLTAALESALRARRGSLRISPDQFGHQARIRCVTKDLLAQPLPWTEPTATSVLEPIRLGIFEDGAPVHLRLLPAPGHGVGVVMAGLPGSGKSGALNVIVAALAACRDVELAGIDPQGTELAPWASVFQPGLLALDSGRDAERVLQLLRSEMEERQHLLRDRGARVWTPSPQAPEIVLVCDEAADLTAYMERLDDLARKGRKVGIHVILATQRPSAVSLGSEGKEALAKLGVALCFQVTNQTECAVVLGPGAAGEGWRADQLLSQPGEFLIRGGEHAVVKRARGFRIDDDDVRRWAARCGAQRERVPVKETAAVEAPQHEWT